MILSAISMSKFFQRCTKVCSLYLFQIAHEKSCDYLLINYVQEKIRDG